MMATLKVWCSQCGSFIGDNAPATTTFRLLCKFCGSRARVIVAPERPAIDKGRTQAT